MKVPTKFVNPLTDEHRKQLKEIMKSQAPQRKRMRAHAILLSDRGYSIDQIADIYQVDRDRVSIWLDWWDSDHFDGLDDDPRRGRPPQLTEEEKKQAVKFALQEPRSLRQGLQAIAEKLGKMISRDTLKRLLVESKQVWKRMRRSLRGARDEAELRAAQDELADLQAEALAPDRELDVWYFDQAGFTLTPCIPYAWQAVGQTLELPCAHSRRQNVLGFLNLHNELHCYVFESSVTTEVVIHCFDLFIKTLSRPAWVILDNAPIHTSAEFEDQLERWQQEGLSVKFLPPYSPELNLIEILWRKIKYEWLPLGAYRNFKTMTESLFEVLKDVGSKYRIIFA